MQISHKEITIGLKAHFSGKTLGTRRQWSKIFHVLKKNIVNPEFHRELNSHSRIRAQ